MRWAPALLAALGGAAQACPAELPGPGVRTLHGERYVLAYRAEPAPAVGEHFAIEIAACARAGGTAPEVVRVDAQMPAHRHGMNYRPSIAAVAPGRQRAQGLMFHMAGRWELSFELGRGDRRERLVDEIVLE